jgi:dUTP pyrophosphatase
MTVPTTLPGVLDRASLLQRLAANPPLVEGLADPAAQVQPNGIDLTVRSVAWLATVGQIGVSNGDRVLPATQELEFDAEGFAHLAPGPYIVSANETLHTPLDLTVLMWPRSSLLRSGVTVHTAVVDAGYEGRLQFTLSVLNPHGFRLQRGARIVQLVAFTLAQPVARGYYGAYQGR